MNRQRTRPDRIAWPKLLRSSARQALLPLLRPPAEPAKAAVNPSVDAELVAKIDRHVAVYRASNGKPKNVRRSRRAAELAAKQR